VDSWSTSRFLHIRAVIQEVFGDLDRAGKMERRLAIPLARSPVWIGGDKLVKFS